MPTVYFDIETKRTNDPAVIQRIKDNIRPPGNYKKQETIDEWYRTQGHEAALEAINRTALDGTLGSLATIGWAVDDNQATVLSAAKMDETTLLATFDTMLRDQLKKAVGSDAFVDSQVKWVIFNADFDARFIWQRSVINNVRILCPPRKRYSDQVYDPMTEWAGYGNYVKQIDLERVFGMSRIDPLGSGADVGQAIDENRWHDVVTHNTLDVVFLREIYKRMMQ